jgi:serine O-acetyltransferase
MSLVANFEPCQSAKAEADLSAAVWARLRQEAEDALAREPALAPIFVNSILNRPAFEEAHEMVPLRGFFSRPAIAGANSN